MAVSAADSAVPGGRLDDRSALPDAASTRELLGVVTDLAAAESQTELLQAIADGTQELLVAVAVVAPSAEEGPVGPAPSELASGPPLELALGAEGGLPDSLEIWRFTRVIRPTSVPGGRSLGDDRSMRTEPLDEDELGLALAVGAGAGATAGGQRRDGRQASRAGRDRRRLEGLRRALAAAGPRATAAAAVEAGIEALGAHGGALVKLTRDGETLETLAASGYPPELVEHWRRFPVSLPTPVGEAIRSGEPVYFRDDDPLVAAEHVDGRPRPGHPAGVTLPLAVDGEALGAMVFTFDDLDAIEAEDHAFLAALASACAYALERAHRRLLYDELGRLQAITAELSRASTPGEVADVVVINGIASLGAQGGAAVMLTEDGAALELIASHGYASGVTSRFERLPLDTPLPLAAAARSGEVIVLETPEEVAGRFPELADEVRDHGTSALVALPLALDDAVVGAIRFTFDTPRVFDEEERRFMDSLAHLCATALERALRTRLHDRTWRLQLMTAALSRAATPEEVGSAVVVTAIGALGASAGAVSERTEKGTLRLLAAQGLPDSLVAAWQEVPTDETTPLGRLAGTREPLLLGSRAEAREREPWVAEQLEALGRNALVVAPVSVGDELVGEIFLDFEDEIDFTPDDEAFVGTLASLCGQALERARLYATVTASREHLHRLLEHLQDGVVSIDTDLRIGFANGEAAALLGPAAVVGRRLPERWGEFSLRGFARELLASDEPVAEARLEGDDGKTYELYGLPDGDAAVLVFRDVTAKERRERAEREFVVNAAHELRTPLAAISTAVEALELGAKDEAWTRDHFISGVASEVDRLNRLIHALLVLARSQADPDWLVPGEVEVEPILVEVVRTLETRPGVRVSYRCAPRATVLGEETLLAAAVANLAQNAARHTESGTITISCDVAVDGACTIAVRDTGGGIPARARAHLLDRFHRGEEEGDGYGLGLAIVRAMARALGASLEIASGADGTTVSLTLAAAR